jgi:hypothetical protein
MMIWTGDLIGFLLLAFNVELDDFSNSDGFAFVSKRESSKLWSYFKVLSDVEL